MATKGREKIVSTAFQLFLKDGYESVSLKNITDATGLSKGAIYHHFDSKRDIYLEALDEYFFSMLQSVSTEDDDLDFKSRIRLRCDMMAQTLDMVESLDGGDSSFPIRTFFIFQLESEKDDTVREKIENAISSFRLEIIAIVQTAMDRGEINLSLSAEVIAYQIIGMVEGLAIHHSTIQKNGAIFIINIYEEVLMPYIDLISNTVGSENLKKIV